MQGTSVPPRRLTAILDDLRDDFRACVSALQAASVRRAHLAPAFMRAFRVWARATGRPFVAFVQQLDPSVPADRDGYVDHPSFQAACYMRRLVEAPETRAQHGKRKGSLSPLAVLAIVIKSAVPRENHDFAIAQLKAVARWHERDAQRLRKSVDAARFVALAPHQPRLVRDGRRRVARPADTCGRSASAVVHDRAALQ